MSIFSRKTVEVQEPLLDHTVYLIDTENVRTVWTLLLDRMTVNDKIYVFYTMNSGNVSYEDLNGVLSSGKSVELIQCHTGKNGLDFQLVSYLGYLIRNNENADYCIISDDSGYDAVIKFWEGRDVDVTRKTAFQVSGKQAKPAKKPLFGGKSRAKAQPAKQADVKKTIVKESAETTNAPASAKAESDKKVRTVKKSTEAEKDTDSAKIKRNSSSIETDAVSKERKIGSGDIFKDEPVRLTRVNPDQIKLVAQPKDDDTMQSSSSSSDISEPDLSIKSASQKAAVSSSPEMLSKLRGYLPEEPEDRIGEIAGIIAKSGGKNGLADIHDEIEKLYRNEKASDIYRAIRKNIKDICC